MRMLIYVGMMNCGEGSATECSAFATFGTYFVLSRLHHCIVDNTYL